MANWFAPGDYSIDSKLYKWNGTNFAEFQSIATTGANDWEFFTTDSDYYLAVANYRNASTFGVDSKIYKWNGINFSEFQSITTSGAFDWEFFTIGSDYYLAVANYHGNDIGSGPIRDSKIYKWNSTNFAEFQIIPTKGVCDWKYFVIDSDHYLVVARYHNGSTYNIDSKIYQATYSTYLPLILKPEPLTYLYVKSTNTGGISSVEIRDPNDGNALLLSCAPIGHNVTTYCGSFPAVGTYRIIAYTTNCGMQQGVFYDATAGATITREVFCN